MAEHVIGGDKWRKLLAAFEAEYNRLPTKAERRKLESLGGFTVPKRKTKGRAADLKRHGADGGSIRRSESINGGIAADNDRGLIALRPKAGRQPKPLTAK